MLEKNKRLVRRLVQEVWNWRNLDLIDELIAPGYVRHDPAWPEPIQGREAMREYVATMRSAFADYQLTVEDLIAEGDRVVVRWTAKATHQGQFLGIRPTFKEVNVPGITILRFEDGQVAEAWDAYDALGLMQQLGVIP